MFNGSNYDRKSRLSGILTEPLNPRGSNGHLWRRGSGTSLGPTPFGWISIFL